MGLDINSIFNSAEDLFFNNEQEKLLSKNLVIKDSDYTVPDSWTDDSELFLNVRGNNVYTFELVMHATLGNYNFRKLNFKFTYPDESTGYCNASQVKTEDVKNINPYSISVSNYIGIPYGGYNVITVTGTIETVKTGVLQLQIKSTGGDIVLKAGSYLKIIN